MRVSEHPSAVAAAADHEAAMTVQEIAYCLGTSRQTARAVLRQALQHFGDELRRRGYDIADLIPHAGELTRA